MLAKRVIPCLDVTDGRVVKGVRFQGLLDAGDPVALATKYYRDGADEIVFLDIGASPEGRKTTLDVIARTARQTFVPLTVGGGVRSVDDVRLTLNAGADKVSVNTAAVSNPELLTESSREFGGQCIVLAIDARRDGCSWQVVVNGGRTPTGRDALEWAREAVDRGVGELLVTSMDSDGTQAGYDIALLRELSGIVRVPVIASGGAGSSGDFIAAATTGRADAVLAASLFHYGTLTIGQVKEEMAAHGLAVRNSGAGDA
jgi:imidazole glycerol-phosphate synthase subunit HisF